MGEQRLSEEQIAELKQVRDQVFSSRNHCVMVMSVPCFGLPQHIDAVFLWYLDSKFRFIHSLKIVNNHHRDYIVGQLKRSTHPGLQWVRRGRGRQHQHEGVGVGHEGDGHEPHRERSARADQRGEQYSPALSFPRPLLSSLDKFSHSILLTWRTQPTPLDQPSDENHIFDDVTSLIKTFQPPALDQTKVFPAANFKMGDTTFPQPTQ